VQQKRDLASLGSKELVQWRQRRGPGGVVPGTESGQKASVTSPEGGRPLLPLLPRASGPHHAESANLDLGVSPLLPRASGPHQRRVFDPQAYKTARRAADP
jgi:hypothetical protein